MSSNIMSKQIDWSKYGVVYAGAQKNMGPAGVTVVIVRNDLIAGHLKGTPLLSDWELQANAPNMYFNTPSTFPIYMMGLNVAHTIQLGGVPVMQALAAERSSLLYSFIDSSQGYYINNVDVKYRSRINIPFRVCNNKELEDKFVAEATQAGLIELKGHASVGGIRVSLYNAMPVEGVHALIAFMTTFREMNPFTPVVNEPSL